LFARRNSDRFTVFVFDCPYRRSDATIEQKMIEKMTHDGKLCPIDDQLVFLSFIAKGNTTAHQGK
jgi:hypothetical protein